ncbi:MAG TPA: hypothetical protein VJ899_03580 [Salegentibacter sp.]|nr:hypothetical protein [Salegentibacter sp.]
MKKLTVILALSFISLSSFTTTIEKPDKALIEQIYVMLDDLPIEIAEECYVEVKLKINEENEIEVLSVKAKDPLVRKVIKKRLDKKTLAIPLKAEGSYLLPIKIKL